MTKSKLVIFNASLEPRLRKSRIFANINHENT